MFYIPIVTWSLLLLVREGILSEKFSISWRWLPHVKIRSLNLGETVHDPRTRDMVLNSFYQMITKHHQQVREAGNEKVHFQPQSSLSILEESWLSVNGLNEFLAEDISPNMV